MDEQKLEEYHDRMWQVHLAISEFYSYYATSVGLTFAAFKVLGIIYKMDSCTQKNITQLSHLPKQTVSAIINNFNQQGIVEKPIESEIDKRNKVIKFTEKGREYAEKIISAIKVKTYKALDSIGEEKRNALIESITLFKENLYIEK